MVNPQNLVSLATRTPEERRAIGRKGGLVRSKRKKWAARLRCMKQKGLTDDVYKKIVAWIEEPESAVLDIYLAIQDMKSRAKTNTEYNNCIRAETELLKFHHKKIDSQVNIQSNDSKNLTINIIKPDGNNMETDN